MGANADLEAAASLFEHAANELELAARHCRTAAGHMRKREVPRGAAHAWAAQGHVLRAAAARGAGSRSRREVEPRRRLALPLPAAGGLLHFRLEAVTDT